MMRKITKIILHCTATHQSNNPDKDIENIKRYWKNNLNWKNVGYHFIIKPDGTYVQLADLETITNGVAGHNANSIHISYIGGVDKNGKSIDNRTIEQKCALRHLVAEMKKKYPSASIHGHNEFAAKDCPCFNVKKEFHQPF